MIFRTLERKIPGTIFWKQVCVTLKQFTTMDTKCCSCELDHNIDTTDVMQLLLLGPGQGTGVLVHTNDTC